MIIIHNRMTTVINMITKKKSWEPCSEVGQHSPQPIRRSWVHLTAVKSNRRKGKRRASVVLKPDLLQVANWSHPFPGRTGKSTGHISVVPKHQQ